MVAAAREAGRVVIVKVCGVRTPEIAEAAIDAGADWIGLMLVPKSPRWVEDAAALAVVRAVGGRADLIGVFVEPSAAECDAAASRYRLAAVQVHGNFDRQPRDRLLGSGHSCLQRGRTVRRVHPRLAARHARDARRDARTRARCPGGTGHRVPLEWAADVARHREILLAGGLGPDDVGDAIAAVRPAGVDASSRLERSPGEKDPELVRALRARGARGRGGALRRTADERTRSGAASTATAVPMCRRRSCRRSRSSRPR